MTAKTETFDIYVPSHALLPGDLVTGWNETRARKIRSIEQRGRYYWITWEDGGAQDRFYWIYQHNVTRTVTVDDQSQE